MRFKDGFGHGDPAILSEYRHDSIGFESRAILRWSPRVSNDDTIQAHLSNGNGSGGDDDNFAGR